MGWYGYFSYRYVYYNNFFHPFKKEYFNKHFHWVERLKNREAVQTRRGLLVDKLEVVDF